MVAAWRETLVFTDAEKAALELAEQGTRLADGGDVTDDAWANAAKHYDKTQLAAIVLMIASTNLANRINKTIRQQPSAP
jgi:alkylhydroperoxidase family enzyme